MSLHECPLCHELLGHDAPEAPPPEPLYRVVWGRTSTRPMSWPRALRCAGAIRRARPNIPMSVARAAPRP